MGKGFWSRVSPGEKGVERNRVTIDRQLRSFLIPIDRSKRDGRGRGTGMVFEMVQTSERGSVGMKNRILDEQLRIGG